MLRKTPKRKLLTIDKDELAASSTTNSKKKVKPSINDNTNEIFQLAGTIPLTKKSSTRKKRVSNIVISPTLSEGDNTVIHPAEHIIRPNINADTYENINQKIPLHWNNYGNTSIHRSNSRINTSSKLKNPRGAASFVPKTIETKTDTKTLNKEDQVQATIESEDEDDDHEITHPTPIRFITNNNRNATRSITAHGTSSNTIINHLPTVNTTTQSLSEERSNEGSLANKKHHYYFIIMIIGLLFSMVVSMYMYSVYSNFNPLPNIASTLRNHLKLDSKVNEYILVETNNSAKIDNEFEETISNFEIVLNSIELEFNDTVSNVEKNILNEFENEYIKIVENNLDLLEETVSQVQNEIIHTLQVSQAIEDAMNNISDNLSQLNSSSTNKTNDYDDDDQENIDSLLHSMKQLEEILENNDFTINADKTIEESIDNATNIDKDREVYTNSESIMQVLEDLTDELEIVHENIISRNYELEFSKISEDFDIVQKELDSLDAFSQEAFLNLSKIEAMNQSSQLLLQSIDTSSLQNNEIELIKESVEQSHHLPSVKSTPTIESMNVEIKNDMINNNKLMHNETNEIIGDIQNIEFDYAVSPRGGRVIAPRIKCPANKSLTLTSFPVKNIKKLLTSIDTGNSIDENIVIRHTKPKSMQFYAMNPKDAKLTILLYSEVNITYISFVHAMNLDESNKQFMNCTPSSIQVNGWTEDPTKIRDLKGKYFDLGEFEFDFKSNQQQISVIKEPISMNIDDNIQLNRTVLVYEQKYNVKNYYPDLPLLRAVTLDIKSNHGDLSYTCIHRIRIVGVMKNLN